VARSPGILPSDFASGGRVPLTGHPWPAAESARSLAPTLRALSSAARRATGGPVLAASCRRNQSKSSRSVGVEATEVCCAVQGCTASWINAPFAVPSIAGVADKARRGAAMDRRACAAVHGCTVCATPQRREAQGILIRRMRIKTPRWALAFLATFWAMPKSSSLARRASESSAPEEARQSEALDSGLRRNDGHEAVSRPATLAATASASTPSARRRKREINRG